MAKNGTHITSCTILWENSEDILRVVTRVLQTEIQVRFYSGLDLMHGKIWAISDEQRKTFIFMTESPRYFSRSAIPKAARHILRNDRIT